MEPEYLLFLVNAYIGLSQFSERHIWIGPERGLSVEDHAGLFDFWSAPSGMW